MDDTSCHDLVALLVAVAAINETAWLFAYFRLHCLKASRIFKLCSVLSFHILRKDGFQQSCGFMDGFKAGIYHLVMTNIANWKITMLF